MLAVLLFLITFSPGRCGQRSAPDSGMDTGVIGDQRVATDAVGAVRGGGSFQPE